MNGELTQRPHLLLSPLLSPLLPLLLSPLSLSSSLPSSLSSLPSSLSSSLSSCLYSQGSYGRLGLGTSDTQTTMKEVNTFPPGTLLRRMASSRGSDGHSLAITAEGQIYSWGDGE